MKYDAIYARYSSHAQDEGTSIEVQLEQCERAAAGACKHYIDRAKTGRTTSGRAQLLAMLVDADAGKIKRVFVYKFDRLGRDAETHVVARQLEEAGVELISTTEGTNQLARGIQFVVAEDYSRQLANRTRDGLVKRFEQGAFTGGVAPYGYRVVTRANRRVLEVDPTEVVIVREIANWYLTESVGFKSIAKRMRKRGIASRRGAGWSFTSVRALLLNPILTGRIRFNVRKMHLDRRSGRRVPRARIEAEHLERHDEALRILDDETFGKIQTQISRAGKGHQACRLGRQIARFSGLVFCACGAKCYKVTSRNAKGGYSYYVCSRHLRYEDCLVRGRIREDQIMTDIHRRLERVFTRTDEIVAGAVKVAVQAARGNQEAADRLKADIGTIEGEQCRVLELLMDRTISDLTKQALNRKAADLEHRREELLSAMDQLRQDANVNTEALAAMVRQVFDEARENLAGALEPEAFNRFAERFIGPMEVGADSTLAQKKSPVAAATGDMQRCIAGACYGPCVAVNSAFWLRAA